MKPPKKIKPGKGWAWSNGKEIIQDNPDDESDWWTSKGYRKITVFLLSTAEYHRLLKIEKIYISQNGESA